MRRSGRLCRFHAPFVCLQCIVPSVQLLVPASRTAACSVRMEKHAYAPHPSHAQPNLPTIVPGFLQFHVEILLRHIQDAHGRIWLPQVIVDADERLHCRVWARLELELLVVQGLGICVTLFCQSPQRPAQRQGFVAVSASCSTTPRHPCTSPHAGAAHLVSSGSAFSSCSMNSARFRRVVTMSGGMVGLASAASSDRTSCSCIPSSSSDQQLTKPAANSSRAMPGFACATRAGSTGSVILCMPRAVATITP